MRFPAAARRATWNLLDQGLSSLTNVVLQILVAQSVAASVFGGFSVAFTVFALLIGASRSVATGPLGIRHSGAAPEKYKVAAGSAAGTALILGVLVGAGCLVAGLLLDNAAGEALIALGVVFPALLVQDAWRYVFFASGRPAAATLNDALWAAVQIAAVVALLYGGVSTVGPLVLAWGGAAAAAAVLGVYQAGTLPRPERVRSWLSANRDTTASMVVEWGALQGSYQGALLLIAAVGSLEAIGALRGAQVLLGPTSILGVAAFAFVVPELSRRRDQLTQSQWLRFALAVSLFVAALGLCWGLLFLFAPDWVGQALLDDTWAGASAVLLPTVVGQLGAALGVGPPAILWAMDRAPVTLQIHIVQAVLLFVGGLGGVLLAGAPGAAWGFAIAFWIVLPLWWWRLPREIRRLTSTAPARQPA